MQRAHERICRRGVRAARYGVRVRHGQDRPVGGEDAQEPVLRVAAERRERAPERDRAREGPPEKKAREHEEERHAVDQRRACELQQERRREQPGCREQGEAVQEDDRACRERSQPFDAGDPRAWPRGGRSVAHVTLHRRGGRGPPPPGRGMCRKATTSGARDRSLGREDSGLGGNGQSSQRSAETQRRSLDQEVGRG